MMNTFLVSSVAITAAALVTAAIRGHRHVTVARALRAEIGRLSDELETSRQLLGQTYRLSAIGMLAASVAHEVRNPLVSVRTFAQLVPERLHDEEFRTHFRDLALAEIDRISLLVNDLLDFARPAAAEIHATDVNDILGQIRRLLDGEAKKWAVQLSADLDESVPAVAVDTARVKQVLLNVVLNAIQACPGGGAVRVATRTVERAPNVYLQVEVRDSGSGIAPERLSRIFDPFFTTKQGGNGLGLFIAQRIVRDHGGDIEVSSTPGVGTVFLVNLPASTAGSERTAGVPAAGGNAHDRPHRSVADG